MEEEFFCRVFTRPGGRYSGPATVRFKEGRLELVLPQGEVWDFAWERVIPRLGGDAESQLVLRINQIGEPDLELYLEDLKALPVVEKVASEPFRESLQRVAHLRRQQRRRGWWWWILVGGLLAGLVWGLLYGLDVATDRVVRCIPPEWETKLGETALQQALGPYQEVTDPVIIGAVETIGSRLTEALENPPYEFHLHVVKAKEVNAFALPGGQVVVFTGLLAAAENPEEVVGVLAHEFQHVLQRHGMKNLVQSLGVRVVLGALIGDSSALLNLLERSATQLLTSQFSRQQETEADVEGVTLLHRAQIPPRGMISFFERLAEKEGTLRTAVSLIASHPLSAQRAERIRKAIAALPPQEPRPLKIEWAEVQRRCRAEAPHPSPVPSPRTLER